MGRIRAELISDGATELCPHLPQKQKKPNLLRVVTLIVTELKLCFYQLITKIVFTFHLLYFPDGRSLIDSEDSFPIEWIQQIPAIMEENANLGLSAFPL